MYLDAADLLTMAADESGLSDDGDCCSRRAYLVGGKLIYGSF